MEVGGVWTRTTGERGGIGVEAPKQRHLRKEATRIQTPCRKNLNMGRRARDNISRKKETID